MNKVCCCCTEPEVPNLSVSVTCVCCQSKVDEHQTVDHHVKDASDLAVDEIDGKEEQVSCCFQMRRKRHAKVERNKKCEASCDGSET